MCLLLWENSIFSSCLSFSIHSESFIILIRSCAHCTLCDYSYKLINLCAFSSPGHAASESLSEDVVSILTFLCKKLSAIQRYVSVLFVLMKTSNLRSNDQMNTQLLIKQNVFLQFMEFLFIISFSTIQV